MGASSETLGALARGVVAPSLSSWSFDDSAGEPFPPSTMFHFLLPNENLFLVSAHLGEWPALGVKGKLGCDVVAPVGSHFDTEGIRRFVPGSHKIALHQQNGRHVCMHE